MRGRGFTLAELLVALGIGGLLLGLLLSTTLGNRRLYVLDQSRTAVNQNLRAALDILVADIRQAGERLPGDFPAVEVRNGNELVLRRNLLDVSLAVCDQNGINGNQDNIPVADKNPPPNATPAYLDACAFRDTNGNRYDDRIEIWQSYSCNSDGVPGCNNGNRREAVRAYIYDPVNKRGEWFEYDAEDGSGVKIHKGNNERWQNSYGPLSRLYILEERRYYLEGGILKLAENGQEGKGLVADVTGFQARARANGSWYTVFPPPNLNWRTLEAVEATVQVRIGSVARTMTTQAVPRNVFSQ
ncbi:prepilin-type cleavage/methylation domain-containing protein [Thermus scotoductus]|uniref:Prepilin-type cleavage/methylation domain-containing protein n=1 Tax=Thermus scotoductus TaxID=37636 RepID=A0A430RI43_THESC|nr:prepilin-type N-terminal cleavage/methylation domain-containing protein [Thermus scotoductus]RTH13645.1 prepilin-type cleavage/methylation domain-containing protein [Thermus scotoductus]